MKDLSRYVNRGSIGAASVLATQSAGAAFAFVFSVLLARLIGASGVGLYFIAMTIIDISATIARLGLDNAGLRFASIAHNREDRGSLAALYRKCLTLVFVTALLVAPVAWLIASHLSLGGDRSNELRTALPLLMAALPAVAMVGLHAELLKGIGAPATGSFAQSACLPLFLLLGGLVLWMLAERGFETVVITYVSASWASVIFALVIWNRRVPGVWREPGKFETGLLLRTSAPLLMAAGMNLVIGWTDILVLGLWSDSKEVGIYGISRALAGLTNFVLNAVNSVTAPQFARLHAQGQSAVMARLAQQSTFWMLLAVAPAVLVFLLAPEALLQLFGPAFKDGAWVLRILTIGQLVNVGTGSVGYLLMMTGYERLLRNIAMLSAAANVVGMVILVPAYGAVGAALSMASCVAFMKLACWLMVRKRLKINTLAFHFSRGELE